MKKARTTQRNFIASYLNQYGKNAVLVAFYTDQDNGKDWRFSFVKKELNLDFNTHKTTKEFSPAKRYSYLVGETESSHTAQQQLLPILEKEQYNPTLEELETAFAIEKISKEFFEEYKKLYLELVDIMTTIRNNDSFINIDFILNKISNDLFCKKLLGQIVFLYFIQKKGWVGVEKNNSWGTGDKKFLRTLFDKAKEKGLNYFNDYLEPLFYEALATNGRQDNYYSQLDCKIPFLNGELFDPINGYDLEKTDIKIPNEFFHNTNNNGVLDIFDIYNFTVREDEPLEKEVAVDPEMLGKVFENLLDIKR